MKLLRQIFLTLLSLPGSCLFAYDPPVFPYAPAAGEEGTTAIPLDDDRIQGWADQVEAIHYGLDVAEEWKHPEKALGEADGIAEGVVVLGRGGEIILSFEPVIQNGPGFDFAVFENGVSDTFLELAYVEVSSDGVHFVRFPNYSQTSGPVGAFESVQPTFIHGYAGKYRLGFGTPFDLDVLEAAHLAAESGKGGFSPEFRSMLTENYSYLELDRISHVRIVDIPGDGNSRDCEGFPVYDPYPTVITSGFDLDAVAVLNQSAEGIVPFAEWCRQYGLDVNPDGDRDGDKWTRYLEYLFGSHPLSTNSKPEIQMTITEHEGIRVLELSYIRAADNAVEQRPTIEFSTDAESWTEWNGIRDTREESPEATGRVEETVRIAIGEESEGLFVRWTGRPL